MEENNRASGWCGIPHNGSLNIVTLVGANFNLFVSAFAFAPPSPPKFHHNLTGKIRTKP